MVKFTNRVRRKFAPLNISVSVSCVNGGLMQTYDGTNYAPDRSLVAAALLPIVEADAKDGSWDSKRSNQALANMKWYANVKSGSSMEWKSLSDIAAWSGLYEIDTTNTASRGTLTVKRNIAPSDSQQLYFEADLVDYRTNMTTHIRTEPVTLYSIDKAEDGYGMGIGLDDNMSYNPALDKLALYEFKVNNQLMEESTIEKTAAKDGNQYLRTIPINVYKGKSSISTGYTLEVYKTTPSNTKETKVAVSTESSPTELKILSLTEMSLDLRLIEKADYIIKAKVGTNYVAQHQFSVARQNPTYNVEFMNKTPISWSDEKRCQKLLVHFANKLVEYPSRLLDIQWYTLADNAGGEDITRTWQTGDMSKYAIADTGLGDTEECYLEDQVEYSQKGVLETTADGEGNLLCDESGEALLM